MTFREKRLKYVRGHTYSHGNATYTYASAHRTASQSVASYSEDLCPVGSLQRTEKPPHLSVYEGRQRLHRTNVQHL